jgi:hypothetical protein
VSQTGHLALHSELVSGDFKGEEYEEEREENEKIYNEIHGS